MNPDEETLALWLDDELTGETLAAMEAWALSNPEQIQAREEIRGWRSMVSSALPAVEDPPYPEFFNTRVLQSIREQTPVVEMPSKKSISWSRWFMPLAACAGMALAFWVGKKTHAPQEIDVAGAPKAIPVEPMVYTPEKGVDAEWFASNKASATVIVLSGVAAIPDTTDFSKTVDNPMNREIDSTASSEIEPAIEVGP